MTSIVDRRKSKFNRYKDLRENPTELLEPAIKPVKEYDAFDRIEDITDEQKVHDGIHGNGGR